MRGADKERRFDEVCGKSGNEMMTTDVEFAYQQAMMGIFGRNYERSPFGLVDGLSI